MPGWSCGRCRKPALPVAALLVVPFTVAGTVMPAPATLAAVTLITLTAVTVDSH